MSKPKNGKVNKSQAIRDILNQKPEASAREVIDLLAQQQIAVKSGLVYMIKGRLAQVKSHTKRRAERIASAGRKTGSADPVALVLKVKSLAKEAGGMHALHALVGALCE